MEIRYRINRYGMSPKIHSVEIERETAEFVFLPAKAGVPGEPWTRERARREHKGGCYFPTFEEAKAALVVRAERELQQADDDRSRAISTLKAARELTADCVKPK